MSRLRSLLFKQTKNCNESQSDEVNGVGSIPVWSGGMDFEEIGQKQNRSFWNVVLEKKCLAFHGKNTVQMIQY